MVTLEGQGFFTLAIAKFAFQGDLLKKQADFSCVFDKNWQRWVLFLLLL